MYAVIRTGGKQYRVEPGKQLLIEKLPLEVGQRVALEEVLAYSNGQEFSIGKPTLPMKISALCVGQEKGPKLRTIKYKKRKNYKKTYGHRQNYTRIQIESF